MQADATHLLDSTLAAHGGRGPWLETEAIEAHVSAGGPFFAAKLQTRNVRDLHIRIATREQRTTLASFPRPGLRGCFTPERVWIESDAGELLAERARPRDAFRLFRRKLWWDDLDLLYFVGYASWNYLAVPFCFLRPGFRLREGTPLAEGGETWRALEVEFPPDVATHSSRQTFYFDARFLLRRLDYTAEVIGSWAKAAHFCAEPRVFGWLTVPTRRRVRLRTRRGPLRFPAVIRIEVHDVRTIARTAAPTQPAGP
jgi:hypothetical protein